MISAFNREVETEKEYNGRQLLELLQNADDEKSEDVRIVLDTVNNVLSIKNRGEACTPFSDKGIRSLMISNLSTKTSKKYIGNKGLGFRSIINWSEKITINSNDLNIQFSNEIVNKAFDEMFSFEERKSIREEQNLPDSVYPIPFLSIPKVTDNPSDNWVTSIEIDYKPEYLDSIQKQINELENEILLFLKSIQRLDVYIDGSCIKTIEKSVLSQKWKVFERHGVLPKEYWDKENEEESFDLKIALQPDLSCDINKVFSYFPTKLVVDFPFIIHGTFELNSSRNEINDSPKNKFILTELVTLIVDTAKGLTLEGVSYKALEMLSYSHPNNILDELGFYSAIDTAIETLNIFPCLDGKYKKKSDVIFVDPLSMFVRKVKQETLFGNLIIPNDGSVNLQKIQLNSEVSNDSLNALSNDITCLNERAEMIHLFYDTFKHDRKSALLVDSNREIISLDDEVYTPSNLDFSIPDYVKIKFIHRELFDNLVKIFAVDSNEKARDLQRKLKDITNIQQYQPIPVLQKIVSNANKLIRNGSVDKKIIIKKMTLCLFDNYRKLVNPRRIPEVNIQLLDKQENLVDSKDIFLSNHYPSGNLTEFLFDGIFDDKDYLAAPSIFGLQEQDGEVLENFFLWLGVNKHTKFIKHTNVIDYKYESYVFEQVQKPVNYRSSSLTYSEIARFSEILRNLSREKLALWFVSDKFIFEQLNNTNNSDEFQFNKVGEYYGSYGHRFSSKPSYITYQVKSKGLFKDYFLGSDKLSPLINESEFDFDLEAFKRLELSRPDIESILLKLGAVDKFEKLSISAVQGIINSLHIKSPEGKHSLAIYKLCIKHFEKNQQVINTSGTLLFSTKGDAKQYFPAGNVFYNGNIKLPKKITSTKAILNYPRRQSTSNVISFFNVNNLSSIEINIQECNKIDSLTEELSQLLELIKPYILVYRIQDIENDRNARDVLSKLKNINIILCDCVLYTIDKDSFELDDNDYLRSGNDYVIKVNKHQSLENLKCHFEFQECFADIIGLVFDIQDTKVFRDMVKDDCSYIEKTIRNDIGSDQLVRSRELLGISDEHYSFWKTVYTLLGKDYELESNEKLFEHVVDDLDISSSIDAIDYSDLSNVNSCKNIASLFVELNIDIVQFNQCKHSYYQIDFTNFHKRNLKQAFENNLYNFKQLLYSWCLKHSKEEIFTTLIAEYEYNEELILKLADKVKNCLKYDYDQYVKEYVEKEFKLLNIVPTDINFDLVFEESSNKISISQLDGNQQYLSLMYFANKLDEIVKFIDSKSSSVSDSKPKQTDSQQKTIRPTIKSVIDVSLNKPSSQSMTKPKSKAPYKYSASAESRKKDAGNKAENEVNLYLVDKYGQNNVTWISKVDDGYGCDFKYNDESGITRYVEVKTHSNHKFYLSKNEFEFARKNVEVYEIFLVADEIYRIKEVDFENKEQFHLDEQEYLVSYNIDPNL